MSPLEQRAEITSENLHQTEFEIAELIKTIAYFQKKYGPFSTLKPAAEGVSLPPRPLFLTDFMLKLQRLQEGVGRFKDDMQKGAKAKD